MPSIEEVEDFSDPDDLPLEDVAPPPPSRLAPAPSSAAPRLPMGMGRPSFSLPADFKNPAMPFSLPTVEKEVYKSWTTLYPIYIDAKRPMKSGFRRIPKKSALKWPMAEHMAEATARLGFKVVLEPTKSHPKDWENPGRVRVMMFDAEGKPVQSAYKDKKTLLLFLSTVLAPSQPTAPTPTPENPHPLPSIHLRLPGNSPAISNGILENALKGGGMGGMLGNMLGGLGGGGGDAEEEKVEPVKKKDPVKVLKPKKVHKRGSTGEGNTYWNGSGASGREIKLYRTDVEAAAAYAGGLLVAVALLVWETDSDYVRFHAYQSSLLCIAILAYHFVLHFILWSWMQWFLVLGDVVVLGLMALTAWRDTDSLARYHLPVIGELAERWVEEE
ncbi:hypothetical protein MNV49_003693 [Pseudohyphozyma bogoriensis]|nr:hypothetical protein MNV49_003693 [Pseudohyphozyma bogoriensis]